MDLRRLTRSLIGIVLASTAPLWAGHSYGDTVTVEIKLGTVLAPGWVVIKKATSGPLLYHPNFPTRCYVTLVYLHGAPIGEVIDVLGHSPIPPGWVKTATYGNTGLDKLQYKIRYRIEKQYEADPPEGRDDLPPVICLPVELDVASMDAHSAGQEKKQQKAQTAPATVASEVQHDS
jgi:hypothetical protein